MIDPKNEAVRTFIKIPSHARAIKKAVFEVTGKQYRIGLRRIKNNSEAPQRDPLEDLIAKASSGNINFELK